MTLNEFLSEVKALKGKYTMKPHGAIRASDKVGYCPIVGLARFKGCEPYGVSDSAVYLGLSQYNTNRIMNAADYTRATQVRTKLLKALGLKERSKK